jgi:hypothetical protein
MKRIVALLVVTGLLATTAAVVYAENATVTVTAGTLSVTPADVTLSEVILDGTDKTATSASGSNSWAAEDPRGTGVGWHLTIDATDFTDAGKTIDVSSADQEFKIQLLDANIAVVSGNAKPTSSVTSLTAIPEAGGTALTFASAAVNEGMGSYTLNPNFELEVPAYILAGNYSSTITVSAVSGP